MGGGTLQVMRRGKPVPRWVASARLEGRGTADLEVASPTAEPMEMFKQLSFSRNTWLSLLWIWEGSN